MNRPERFESLKQRFAEDHERYIDERWLFSRNLSLDIHSGGGIVLNEIHDDLDNGIAVSLGSRNNYTAWLELRKLHESMTPTLEVNLINSARKIGGTALMDSVLLVPGDVYTVGRYKYPELDPSVSRQHLRIRMYEPNNNPMFLRLEDMNSANGAVLFPHRRTQRAGSHDDWDSESYPTGPSSQQQSPHEQDDFKYDHESNEPDEVEELVKKYSSKYKSLGHTDFHLCLTVAKHLQSTYPDNDSTSRKKLEREVNKCLHPDMNPQFDAMRAHETLLLAKELLGL